MKKWIIFLAFILIALLSYRNSPVLAEEISDDVAVKKIVEIFVQDLYYGNALSVKQVLSKKYSSKSINKLVVNYDKFEDFAKKFKSYFDDKFSNKYTYSLSIPKIDIRGDKAKVEIEIGWKGTNRVTGKEESGTMQRRLELAKEEGVWKVTCYTFMEDTKIFSPAKNP